MDTTSEKFKIGSIYRYEEIMPSIDKKLDAFVEALTGSREEILVIEGPVIYNDGTTAIIKARTVYVELECYALNYAEVCQRFDDFVDNEVRFINPQKYLCMDILTEESRFFVDPETGDIHDVLR